MSSWESVSALSGFHYSGVEKSVSFTYRPGNYFWSNGYAWGTCNVENKKATLFVISVQISLKEFKIVEVGSVKMKEVILQSGENNTFEIT